MWGQCGRGFSLFEMLVVTSLLLALVAGAVLYHVSGQRQSLATDFRAASLQAAQLVVSSLQRDVTGMVPGPLVTTYAEPTPSREVTLTRVTDRSDVRGLPLDTSDALVTETVTWKFDAASHLLLRSGEPLRAAGRQSGISRAGGYGAFPFTREFISLYRSRIPSRRDRRHWRGWHGASTSSECPSEAS